ncbi:23S rRNA pseudouridine(1911/1915/1917) synthase RluD [Pseudazoarcus pumilus]|uniref:Pseudouridine synthase n=2 Tax=Pseudazoarcus pumilus TaxID=2067960 RepID=A0A2I6S7B3_9RHOO|nr:23S rRNA pseudouridine(1911/1915/1917) synthase RluD [Pseudazoarcus pumilus]
MGGQRVDRVLAQLFPEHSRTRLQAWLRDGYVLVDGAAREAKHKLRGGEHLSVVEPEAEPLGAELPEDIPLAVLFEDAHILVLDKPPGLVVHPGSGNRSGTLLNALLHHAPQLETVPRAGIVHRLDKETSGLMVVAKTLAAQTALVRQLQARDVGRHYLALVHGALAGPGSVDAPVGRHPTHRTKMAVIEGGREARTHYVVRERLRAATLVECRLETGRTHQIRVHMASIGHPLVGDPVYGRRRSGDALRDAFARQALHAFRLALVHPASGEPMQWEVGLPADFAHLLDALRREAGA